jgi:preprotein translocase subunit YajC
MSFLVIIVLFVLAWVVLILPKQREVKRHGAFVESLRVGDEVMTGSGIYGTLVQIDEATVLLQVCPGMEMKVARRAIASRIGEPTTADSDSSDKSADDDVNDEDSDA